MRTDAGITVHSHLRMSGRWTVVGAGKRLPRAAAARAPHGRETWWCPGCQH